jgi:hypothetical protein
MLPAGAVAGRGLHPLESAALSRRTSNPVILLGLGSSGWVGWIPSLAALSPYVIDQARRRPRCDTSIPEAGAVHSIKNMQLWVETAHWIGLPVSVLMIVAMILLVYLKRHGG